MDVLEQYAYKAKLAAQAGDWESARNAWAEALTVVPPGSPEHAQVRQRIDNIDLQLSAADGGVWKKRLYKLGPLGVFLFKFKTILLIAVTKGKFLLLGLSKMSTVLSMLLSIGVYSMAYGWRFALGLVLSIYVHEMGHVVALRRYGIAASAPMFIPGFGALVRLHAYPHNTGEDARVGLAGPFWGLGAAAFAWACGVLTGAPIWFAIARTGAWINMFNLMPIWQLDGGRGFRALTRTHRGWMLGLALVLWALTSESMLLFIAMGAAYRFFASHDAPEQPDTPVLWQFAFLLSAFAGMVYFITP